MEQNTKNSLTRGLARWTSLVMMGDGLAGFIWPSRYLRKLKAGPSFLKETLEALAERPALTRALCVAEVAVGFWAFRR